MKAHNSLKINHRTRIATKADGTQLPVLDGKFDFIIEPNEEEIRDGIPGDPTQCMYCLALKRLVPSAEFVWVTRTIAYVEMMGHGGKREIRRFILTKPARKAIYDFDTNREDCTPEAVIFSAPKGSLRLDAILERKRPLDKKRREKRREKQRKAFLNGTISPLKKEDVKKVSRMPLGLALRQPASGRFHFAIKEQAAGVS
jgi:hypothetical protein